MEEDPLAVDNNNISEEKASAFQKTQRKRLGVTENSTPNSDIYHTPSKKNKDQDNNAEATPTAAGGRRKSILKSATTRMAEGTPKRNIQLSNIVEKRIFDNNDIISTPTSRGRRKSVLIDRAAAAAAEETQSITPSKRQTKQAETESNTPSRRRSRSKAQKTENSDDDEEYSPKKMKTPSRRSRAQTSPNSTTANAVTPSQKLKLIRSGNICPSIEKRQTNTPNKRKSELQLARESLHVSVVPKSLPCREKEFENIYTFLEGKIQDQCGGCMYVSGVPGTGKTATVTGVIRKLQAEVAKDELPPFDFLEINGMRLTEPRQAYVQIYKQLTGKTVSWEQAHSLLEKRFTTSAPRRVTTVLLVDELDILCNRRQDVVYNLLDWPSKSAARLVVVTIANTMDLPERLLMGKVTSRLGLTRLTFQPYTHKQLQEIVTARLAGSEAFKGDAVQLVAR